MKCSSGFSCRCLGNFCCARSNDYPRLSLNEMRFLLFHSAVTPFTLHTLRLFHTLGFGTRKQYKLISILCYIFLFVNLTFEMSTLREQHHSFSTHGRMFLWKCRCFWGRKCLDPRGRILLVKLPTRWNVLKIVKHIFTFWIVSLIWSDHSIWNEFWNKNTYCVTNTANTTLADTLAT